ncbi:MAG TPA: DUF1501 domain-containing protein [Albitalea sp.]|uniref:DUF1501 domain-containing protein n=1 Tax=Piscinibacter sp. TaxID=1903157 RepID=UPI002ED172A3
MKTRLAVDRRRLLAAAMGAVALTPWSSLSLAGQAGAEGARFALVILRGGLDGLSAVPAVGDADFAPARAVLGQFAAPVLSLPGGFALHPQLAQLHAMVGRNEALVVHAVGLAYRERSHFDAQQVLESGGLRPYELSTGWLARALAAGRARGLALNTAVPLVLRGPGQIDTWAPSALSEPSSDLVARIERMYAVDAALAAALQRARSLHGDASMTAAMGDGAGARGVDFSVLARRAAEFLSQPQGPQAAVLELSGWDTHANQAAPNGALANNLRRLDAGLAALREGLVSGGAWPRTVIVVATEFGREVAMNGTQGTDHGTGGAAFVLGGAVKGGRVVADWPGLGKRDRFEGRDLRTTTDLRALLKGVLGDHLRVASRTLDREVFPGSEGLRPVSVLA